MFRAYALLPATSRDDRTPMVLNTWGRLLVAVTDEAAANPIKHLLSGAASLADADSATALRNASAHWLRHTMPPLA